MTARLTTIVLAAMVSAAAPAAAAECDPFALAQVPDARSLADLDALYEIFLACFDDRVEDGLDGRSQKYLRLLVEYADQLKRVLYATAVVCDEARGAGMSAQVAVTHACGALAGDATRVERWRGEVTKRLLREGAP